MSCEILCVLILLIGKCHSLNIKEEIVQTEKEKVKVSLCLSRKTQKYSKQSYYLF